MRKVLGLVLLGLSGFLIAASLLLFLWAPGKVERTPLNVDSITRLTGKATYLSEAETPVKAISANRVDVKASSDEVVQFNTFTCLVRDPDNNVQNCVKDKRLITSDVDTFATDRHTAQAVTDYPNLPTDAVPHTGLVNKFPFNVEKKTYNFWDGVLGKSVPAEYKGTEKIQGLETYKFVISFADQPAKVTAGVDGTYSDDKTMWVDPVTGSIINQQDKQVRKLQNGDNAITLDFAFTDDTVKKNVQDANDNRSQLSLVNNAPLVLLPLGIIAGVVGAFLTLGARNAGGRHRNDEIDWDEVDQGASSHA